MKMPVVTTLHNTYVICNSLTMLIDVWRCQVKIKRWIATAKESLKETVWERQVGERGNTAGQLGLSVREILQFVYIIYSLQYEYYVHPGKRRSENGSRNVAWIVLSKHQIYFSLHSLLTTKCLLLVLPYRVILQRGLTRNLIMVFFITCETRVGITLSRNKQYCVIFKYKRTQWIYLVNI